MDRGDGPAHRLHRPAPPGRKLQRHRKILEAELAELAQGIYSHLTLRNLAVRKEAR